ncbi:MAG: hypothetical protein IJY93_04185 [Clostridia bacterium]|nr:hypothetical protein [Clostridia bacterium]
MKIILESLKRTFTHVWVSRLLWFSCIWISLSYVLAFLGKEQIAESLSETVATVIVATVLGYLCKSFFETREEENLKYKREQQKNTENGRGE